MLTLQTLEEAGNGRVLIVDGQASKRCALLGDLLAAKMHRNGWAVSFSASCICDVRTASHTSDCKRCAVLGDCRGAKLHSNGWAVRLHEGTPCRTQAGEGCGIP